MDTVVVVVVACKEDGRERVVSFLLNKVIYRLSKLLTRHLGQGLFLFIELLGFV